MRTKKVVLAPAAPAAAAVTHTIAPLALSIDAAAAALSVSKAEVYNHLRSGALPITKIGKRTLIRLVDLEEFLAARTGAKLSTTPMTRAIFAAKKSGAEAPKEERHAAPATP